MNENAQKWVAALRSGDYEQGIGYLHIKGYGSDPDKFCCLGVACVLAEQEGVTTKVEAPDDGQYVRYSGTSIGGNPDEFMSWLPVEVRDWLGLKADTGDFDFSDGMDYTDAAGRPQKGRSLTQLNDSAGYDFGDIADVIEREPEGLFA